MKIEIGTERPGNFATYWPGQYEVFSHLEYACGIPSVLYAITTLKDNGLPNVSFNAWSSFSGEGTGFHAIVPGVSRGGHTYRNILRTGEFVINFLSKAHYDGCIATIQSNADGADEFVVGGFTREEGRTVACPRIQEAFLCLECRLEKEFPLSPEDATSVVIGKVNHIAAQEDYAKGIDAKYGDDGFMLNIHAPRNLLTGEGKASAIAVLKVARVNEEG